MRTTFITILLLCIFACTGEDSRQMHEALMQAKAQNENFEPFTTDSTMLRVVDYYDAHGSANEQMLAHYLLGCVYRDLGDAPRALECYHDAVSKADTTDAACDFQRLSRIYGQMADLFYYELLPYEYIAALSNADLYALKSNDSLSSIIYFEQKANAYELLNKKDSIEIIRKKSYDLYKKYGYDSYAAISLLPLAQLYIEEGRLLEANDILVEFEKLSGLFNNNGNIRATHEIYYYIKGSYYLEDEKLDSALHYFYIGSKSSERVLEASYKGLMLTYKKMNEQDSIVKYALLCYEKNENNYISSYMNKLGRIQSIYNYEHNKTLILKKDVELLKNKAKIIVLSLAIILLIIIIIYVIYRKRKEEQIKELLYKNDINNLKQAQSDLNKIIESKHNELIEEKNQTITILKNKLIADGLFAIAGIEEKLTNNEIVKTFKYYTSHPKERPTSVDWNNLISFINIELPNLYGILNSKCPSLSDKELKVCILIRLHFSMSDICNLMDIKSSNLSMLKRRLFTKIFRKDGSAVDFDKFILSIC